MQKFHYSRPVRRGTVDPENEFAVSVSSPLQQPRSFPWASVPARACSCSIIMGGPLTQTHRKEPGFCWYDDTRLPGSSVGFVVSFLEPLHSPCNAGLARALSASGSSQSPVSLCFPGPVCYSQGLRLAQGASSKSLSALSLQL